MRGIRWCTVVLVVVEAALLVTGRIALGHAVLILVCVETICALAVLSAAGIRYHHSRRSGQSSPTSAAAAASAVLPGPIFRLAAREAQLVAAVARWLLRRPIHGRPINKGPSRSGNAVPIAVIPYGRDQVAFVWIFMALTVLEIAVVEIIVPWTALRMILLVLGVYGLLIMAGFVAANRTRPHLLTRDSLHLRCGLLAEVAVPMDLVTSVSVGTRNAGYGPLIVGDTLTLGVAGSTHVALNLAAAFPVRAGKAIGEVRTIRIATDESSTAARLIRSQLPDANDTGHTSSDIRAADLER